MAKQIPENIIKDLIQLIKNSEFYNKIQITFDFQGASFKTETFYFAEDIIGHSIMEEKDGQAAAIQETEEYSGTNEIEARLQSLPEDAKIIIAGNSPEFVLTLKLD
jgi:hypothetical protein